MNDTDPKIAAKFRELLGMKRPEERLIFGCSMHETARRIVISSIRQDDPGISKENLRRRLFLRFYKNDFLPTKQQNIIAHLEKL